MKGVKGMKIKKLTSIMMAGILAASALTVHAKDSEYLGRGTVGDKWYASSVYGAVTKDTEVSLKDDYFTAVVRDELVGPKIEPGYSAAGVFRDAEKIMRDRTLALLRDTEPASHDGRLVSSFYELAMDWKGRNKTGLTAFRDDEAACDRKTGSHYDPCLLSGCQRRLFSSDTSDEISGRNLHGGVAVDREVSADPPAVEDQPEGGSAYVECRHVDKASECIL